MLALAGCSRPTAPATAPPAKAKLTPEAARLNAFDAALVEDGFKWHRDWVGDIWERPRGQWTVTWKINPGELLGVEDSNSWMKIQRDGNNHSGWNEALIREVNLGSEYWPAATAEEVVGWLQQLGRKARPRESHDEEFTRTIGSRRFRLHLICGTPPLDNQFCRAWLRWEIPSSEENPPEVAIAVQRPEPVAPSGERPRSKREKVNLPEQPGDFIEIEDPTIKPVEVDFGGQPRGVVPRGGVKRKK